MLVVEWEYTVFLKPGTLRASISGNQILHHHSLVYQTVVKQLSLNFSKVIDS